jgi:hypothetical protein
MEPIPAPEAAAAVTGRHQAFAMIASHCSYAQAVCLREIHQTRAYEHLGLTWEEFCNQQAGISRGTAESVIRRLDEFGESYFRLSAIARISPEAFREIAARITAETIDLDGEQIPLTRENAQKIRAGIQRLRDECRRLTTRYRMGSDITEHRIRLDDTIKAVTKRAEIARAIPKDELAGLRALADHAIARWTQVADLLSDA